MQQLVYDPNDLNLPLGEVFTNHPEKWDELINIKALVGAYLANLERVFRGAFDSGVRARKKRSTIGISLVLRFF